MLKWLKALFKGEKQDSSSSNVLHISKEHRQTSHTSEETSQVGRKVLSGCKVDDSHYDSNESIRSWERAVVTEYNQIQEQEKYNSPSADFMVESVNLHSRNSNSKKYVQSKSDTQSNNVLVFPSDIKNISYVSSQYQQHESFVVTGEKTNPPNSELRDLPNSVFAPGHFVNVSHRKCKEKRKTVSLEASVSSRTGLGSVNNSVALPACPPRRKKLEVDGSLDKSRSFNIRPARSFTNDDGLTKSKIFSEPSETTVCRGKDVYIDLSHVPFTVANTASNKVHPENSLALSNFSRNHYPVSLNATSDIVVKDNLKYEIQKTTDNTTKHKVSLNNSVNSVSEKFIFNTKHNDVESANVSAIINKEKVGHMTQIEKSATNYQISQAYLEKPETELRRSEMRFRDLLLLPKNENNFLEQSKDDEPCPHQTQMENLAVKYPEVSLMVTQPNGAIPKRIRHRKGKKKNATSQEESDTHTNRLSETCIEQNHLSTSFDRKNKVMPEVSSPEHKTDDIAKHLLSECIENPEKTPPTDIKDGACVVINNVKEYIKETDNLVSEENKLMERKVNNKTRDLSGKDDTVKLLDSVHLSNDISCLYNHDGKLCTVASQRYIKTSIPKSNKVVLVCIETKEVVGTKVGCKILWRGQTPIPLSLVKDGIKVKFDAVMLSDNKTFQALVIWQNDKAKPGYVTEPSNRAYIWVDGRTLSCEDLINNNGVMYAHATYDGKKISAELAVDVLYIDSKKVSFSAMKLRLDSHRNKTYALVYRLMIGRKGADFRYICVCVWSGVRPQIDSSRRSFQRGELYRLNSAEAFVADANPCRLYCDVTGLLKITKKECTLEYEVENGMKIVEQIPMTEIYSGNYRVKQLHPQIISVKAHIQKVTNMHWLTLLVQIPGNKTNMLSSKQLLMGIEGKASNELVSGKVSSNGISYKQMDASSLLLVKGADTQRSLSKNNAKTQLNARNIDVIKSGSKQKQPLKNCQYPDIIDATGFLICVRGDYGILKIRNKCIKGSGEALASFHRSVAYVGQLPIYKDVPFLVQLENLYSEVWHCSVTQHHTTIQDMRVQYQATLSWQGLKPTEYDIRYFNNLPLNSVIFYHSKTNVSGDRHSLNSCNSARGVYMQQSSFNAHSSRGNLGLPNLSDSETREEESLLNNNDSLDEEMEGLTFDDADMFPVAGANDDRDIVDA